MKYDLKLLAAIIKNNAVMCFNLRVQANIMLYCLSFKSAHNISLPHNHTITLCLIYLLTIPLSQPV